MSLAERGRDRRRGRRLPRSSPASSGVRVVPPLFDCVERYQPLRRHAGRRSRSPSPWPSPSSPTPPSWRPIVGAFVAGLALARSRTVGPHPPRARPGRPPLHPGLLPPDRHRCRGRPRSSTPRCSASPARAARRRASSASLSSAVGAARCARRPAAHRPRHAPPRRGRASSSPPSACSRACSATTSTPPCSSWSS